MKSDSLKTKDLIHVGVYTAIYIVVFFTVGMINAIPFLYPLLFILVPLITGIPFMLFLTKVEKFGMVSIMAVIIGIFWYIMGYTWIPTVSFIVLGLISDFVMKTGKYKKFSMNILGFVIFSCSMLGLPAPMWLMTETYMAGVREAMGEKYVMEVTKFMPPWMGFVALVCIIISSIFGAFIGRRMLKKHFERAGIA